MINRINRVLVIISLFAFSACNGSQSLSPETPAAPPPPDTSTQVIPTESEGPVQITYISSDPTPGSTISGCGPSIAGCTGRLRMRFQLLSGADGSVLGMNVFLHATNEIACLWSRTDDFELKAGQPTVVDVVLDRADECATPLTMATMDVVLDGPVQIGSRQAWGLRYFFNP